MLTVKLIQKLFHDLSLKLQAKGEIGEIGIVGGVVMCLVYQARSATKDVDAIFEPTQIIRTLAAQVGEENGIGPHWLNDGAKAYIQGNIKRVSVLELPNLRVWAPEAKYMLAMKCLSARWDSHDQDDVIFLLRFLKLEKPAAVYACIENYFPKNKILPKTQFFIEEIFEEKMIKPE